MSGLGRIIRRRGRPDVLALALTLLGLALRLALALVNRQANDDHLEVVGRILSTGALPIKGDCFECYQPKLYHILLAGTIRLFGIRSIDGGVVAGQLLNLLVGAGALLLVWDFLRRAHLPRKAQILAFSLVALNPRIIATNAQASNDSLIVFLGVLSTWAMGRFLLDGLWKDAAWAILGIVLAALAKGSGLVFFVWGVMVLAVQILAARSRLRGPQGSRPGARPGRVLVVLVIAFAVLVPFGGQYVQNWQRFGSPLVLNIPKDPPPHLFQPTVVRRPGVLSVADAFFTFRFADLLNRPYDVNLNEKVPRHRTSLWSQVYGWNASANFPQWPESWQSLSPRVVALTRALLLLQLLPLGLGLAGLLLLVREEADFARSLRSLPSPRKEIALDGRRDWILLPLSAAFIVMLLWICYNYRDFSLMKSIYLAPAMLFFVACLGRGLTWWIAWTTRVKAGWAGSAVEAALWVLGAVSAIEVADLILRLAGKG